MSTLNRRANCLVDSLGQATSHSWLQCDVATELKTAMLPAFIHMDVSVRRDGHIDRPAILGRDMREAQALPASWAVQRKVGQVLRHRTASLSERCHREFGELGKHPP